MLDSTIIKIMPRVAAWLLCLSFAGTGFASTVGDWTAGDTVVGSIREAEAAAFVPISIPAHVLARVKGHSLPSHPRCPKPSDLRYIRMLHYTYEGAILKGEMIVNKDVANDIAYIFRKLYMARYPIERIRLIDEYGADDETSMRANNSSAFCFRSIAGSTRLSKHALGRAVDINPLYNPCFKVATGNHGDSIAYKDLQPKTAAPYTVRSASFPYKITADDLAVRLFKSKGFKWGGDWKSCKDYQHFER